MLAASFAVQVLLVIAGFAAFGLLALAAAIILFREEDQSLGEFLFDFMWFR
jgi:hypothetical protein